MNMNISFCRVLGFRVQDFFDNLKDWGSVTGRILVMPGFFKFPHPEAGACRKNTKSSGCQLLRGDFRGLRDARQPFDFGKEDPITSI